MRLTGTNESSNMAISCYSPIGDLLDGGIDCVKEGLGFIRSRHVDCVLRNDVSEWWRGYLKRAGGLGTRVVGNYINGLGLC